MHETQIAARKRRKERIGRMVGSHEGLRDPHEMPFDTGNLFAIVVTKSRKTGPLRPRCSERLGIVAVKESPTSLTSSRCL